MSGLELELAELAGAVVAGDAIAVDQEGRDLGQRPPAAADQLAVQDRRSIGERLHLQVDGEIARQIDQMPLTRGCGAATAGRSGPHDTVEGQLEGEGLVSVGPLRPLQNCSYRRAVCLRGRAIGSGAGTRCPAAVGAPMVWSWRVYLHRSSGAMPEIRRPAT